MDYRKFPVTHLCHWGDKIAVHYNPADLKTATSEVEVWAIREHSWPYNPSMRIHINELREAVYGQRSNTAGAILGGFLLVLLVALALIISK